MIELKIEGCCRDCDSIAVELRKFGKEYWVKCIHEDVCGKLEKEKKEGEKDTHDKTEPSFKVDGIGDNDPTIHAIAYLQKVGWLQEHDRALTEPNSSEKPNNCEHITEGGVTCAKYPACDDCLDNPLNKVKGAERLVKGSDEPQQKSCATCKHALGNWDGESNNCGRCCGADRRFYEPKDEPQTYVINPQEPTNNDKCFECDDFFTCGGQCNKIEDEPMKTTDYCDICKRDMCEDCIADATNPYCVPSHYEINYEPKDEPQTDCQWK